MYLEEMCGQEEGLQRVEGRRMSEEARSSWRERGWVPTMIGMV